MLRIADTEKFPSDRKTQTAILRPRYNRGSHTNASRNRSSSGVSAWTHPTCEVSPGGLLEHTFRAIASENDTGKNAANFRSAVENQQLLLCGSCVQLMGDLAPRFFVAVAVMMHGHASSGSFARLRRRAAASDR